MLSFGAPYVIEVDFKTAYVLKGVPTTAVTSE